MRNNPNKVIKVITKNGPEWWQFITGKMLAFYLLVLDLSYRVGYDKNTYELKSYGQTKAVRFFCDKKELEELLIDNHKKGGQNG